MEAETLIARLERFPDALAAVLAGLGEEDAAWRPADGGWSVTDVLVHLVSEETVDFRERLRRTLEDPAQDWPPLDVDGVVEASRARPRSAADLLRAFRDERRASVEWLRGMQRPRWDSAHVRPTMGTLRAGDLLASWAAHDVRHLAQIAKRLHGLAGRDGGPYSVAYAG